MGCMGVIYSYVIEVRAQFGLSEDKRETTWLDIKPMLESGEIFRSTRYSAKNSGLKWIGHHPNATERKNQGFGILIKQ